MKNLFVIRHEDRPSPPFFFTKLSALGYKNAKSIVIDDLHKLNISKIYTSPFIRTLETIQPYCIKFNKKVFIENSLYEYTSTNQWKNQPIYGIKNIQRPDLLNIIDNGVESKSFLPLSDVTLERDYSEIISNFLDKIIDDGEENVLLVTHMYQVDVIFDYFMKKYRNERYPLHHYYPTGCVSKISINENQGPEALPADDFKINIISNKRF